jgi:hypothetical protein
MLALDRQNSFQVGDCLLFGITDPGVGQHVSEVCAIVPSDVDVVVSVVYVFELDVVVACTVDVSAVFLDALTLCHSFRFLV